MSTLLQKVQSGELNPIIYMPMTSAEDCHINYGYGGNFTVNGTLATADRGANQDNCVASKFDGVDDYLSKTIGVLSDTQSATVSLIVSTTRTVEHTIFSFNNGTYGMFEVTIDADRRIYIRSYDNAGTNVFLIDTNATLGATNFSGRYMNISACIDTFNDVCKLLINNEVVYEWTIGTFLNIPLSQANVSSIGLSQTGVESPIESLGELYFDTNYIDLATNNPFWDSETNKPIPVRTAMANLGSNPLICMPISADAPHINYGSGGNFTLNGGGLQGSRGMSEYISRSCVVDASNYLTGSTYCESLVKWTSSDGGATWTVTYANAVTVTNIGNGTDNGVVSYYFGFSDNINWALESNKNLVTNQLGYSRDPKQVIKDSGWTPVLGLFFNDTSNFGKNDYGADYSVIGSPTSGADISV